jgi:xanthine/CO dehydrogenase XdhC/CoxF family maturation factor
VKELKAIVEAWEAKSDKYRMALATVVRVRGSAYRSPGARMLIWENGKWVGSISGGCLEGDALRRARRVMSSGTTELITYDTREESNQQLGIGLGCNGVIDVFIEPVIPDESSNPILLFRQLVQQNEPVVLATVIEGSLAGKKMMVDKTGVISLPFPDDQLTERALPVLRSLHMSKLSQVLSFGNETLFAEWIQPLISLLILGGGYDARPLCTFAKALGWNVDVTDECAAHIAPVFFPTADRISLCQRQYIHREFPITPFTACVLMSHNYAYDRDVLAEILPSPSPYIGIIGPRKRFEKMLIDLKERGIRITSDDLNRIHAPAGLDIGAETPDEIAISILAEIQSKFTGREGGFLKHRKGPIHQREKHTDEVFKPAVPLDKTFSR